jgi:hypothetical protein
MRNYSDLGRRGMTVVNTYSPEITKILANLDILIDHQRERIIAKFPDMRLDHLKYKILKDEQIVHLGNIKVQVLERNARTTVIIEGKV